MRAAVALLLATAACGGGGGGGGAVGGDQVDAREEAARQVLAACAREGLAEYLDVVRSIHDMTQLSAPAQVTYVAVTGALNDRISVEIDVDGAPGAELVGTIRFLDPQDQTVVPTDLQAIVDGTSLRDALTGVPAGNRLLMTFISAGGGNINGQFFATIDGGIANQMRGNLTARFVRCSTTLALRLTPISNFNGSFPGATSDFSMQSENDTVTGVVVMDQTNTAAAEVTLNGSSGPFAFLINLNSGAVTGG